MRKKPIAYLAGRMSGDAADLQWRKDLTPFLETLGWDVANPYDFEPHQLKGLKPGRLPDGYKHWYELKNATEPNLKARFLNYMRRIIKYDMNMIKSNVDYVVAHWTENCKTGAGTQSELTLAFDRGIPVYCVASAELPAWTVGCCERIFKDFDELRAFLQAEFDVDTSEVELKK